MQSSLRQCIFVKFHWLKSLKIIFGPLSHSQWCRICSYCSWSRSYWKSRMLMLGRRTPLRLLTTMCQRYNLGLPQWWSWRLVWTHRPIRRSAVRLGSTLNRPGGNRFPVRRNSTTFFQNPLHPSNAKWRKRQPTVAHLLSFKDAIFCFCCRLCKRRLAIKKKNKHMGRVVRRLKDHEIWRTHAQKCFYWNG